MLELKAEWEGGQRMYFTGKNTFFLVCKHIVTIYFQKLGSSLHVIHSMTQPENDIIGIEAFSKPVLVANSVYPISKTSSTNISSMPSQNAIKNQ